MNYRNNIFILMFLILLLVGTDYTIPYYIELKCKLMLRIDTYKVEKISKNKFLNLKEVEMYFELKTYTLNDFVYYKNKLCFYKIIFQTQLGGKNNYPILLDDTLFEYVYIELLSIRLDNENEYEPTDELIYIKNFEIPETTTIIDILNNSKINHKK